MKDFPMCNIFLPATFVGVSLFSITALMLPAFIERYSPTGQLGERGQSSLSLTGIHKEVVITYIGSAIVISASAGLGAAELLRKRSAQKAKTPHLKSLLTDFVDREAQQGFSDIDEHFTSVLAEQLGKTVDWHEAEVVTNEKISPSHLPALKEDLAAALPDSAWEDSALSDRFEPAQAELSARATDK